VQNQRMCGGDWPEGWNYGPDSVRAMALVYQTLRDYGVDWSADFDWLQAEPAWLTYNMSPDFANLFSFGGYSGNLAHKTSPGLLSVLSTSTVNGALAARLYTSGLAAPTNDFSEGSSIFEMLFSGPSATAEVARAPLSYLASGTGRWISKSSM